MATEVRANGAGIPTGLSQIGEGDAKVLLIKDDHGLRAFQATCPHLGAPLAKGRVCDHTLYCPWHKAAFDIGDGALSAPPALKGLEQYPIHTDGESIVVTMEALPASRPGARAHDARTFLIVGTGAAAVAAAVRLRHEGYGGRLVMIGREDRPPYDRTKLSKQFLAKKTDADAVALEKDFFAAHRAEHIAASVTHIDPAACAVTLTDGRTLTGDALLVATGSRAVVPRFDGAGLPGVKTLRSLDDAVTLTEAADTAKTVAIVGGGFIGLEAAAFLTKRGLAVTVISREPLPLAARFGDEVARALRIHHEGTGVRFITGEVARFEGEAAVRAVRLKGGETVEAELVVVAAGAAPETTAFPAELLRDDGGIEVDAHLRLAPKVWLAGDIAAFPEPRSGTTARIEHWRLAEQHGEHAARGMLGVAQPFVAAPFFWSNQGDKRLDYAGYAPDWDEIIFDGDPAKLDFIAYYVRRGDVLAACAIGRNEALIDFLHRLDGGRSVPACDLNVAPRPA